MTQAHQRLIRLPLDRPTIVKESAGRTTCGKRRQRQTIVSASSRTLREFEGRVEDITTRSTAKNSFNHIRPVKAFFQCMDHSVALYEVIAIFNALLDRSKDEGSHLMSGLALSLAARASHVNCRMR